MRKKIKHRVELISIFLVLGLFLQPGSVSAGNDSDLVENVDAAVRELEKKLPRGKDNVRDVLVKFTMTKPVVVVEKK